MARDKIWDLRRHVTEWKLTTRRVTIFVMLVAASSLGLLRCADWVRERLGYSRAALVAAPDGEVVTTINSNTALMDLTADWSPTIKDAGAIINNFVFSIAFDPIRANNWTKISKSRWVYKEAPEYAFSVGPNPGAYTLCVFGTSCTNGGSLLPPGGNSMAKVARPPELGGRSCRTRRDGIAV